MKLHLINLTLMKSYRSILFLLLAVIHVSCERAENPLTSGLSGGEGWFMLNFGASEYNKVETKSHQTIVTESQVKNLYIFIFDSNTNNIDIFTLYTKKRTNKNNNERRRNSSIFI